MKNILMTLSLVLISASSFGQVRTLWSLDDISNISVMTYEPVDDKSGKTGSATIIRHNSKFFLLTATHVARELTKKSKIAFRIQNDKLVTLDLVSLSATLNWKYHPTADVALLELIPTNKDVEQRFINWSFESSNIYQEKELIFKEFELTFLGYPLKELDVEHFSPLTFACHYASGLITQFIPYINKKCSVFFLDRPSIEGASGSALYLSVKKEMSIGSIDKTILVGIVSGTFSDNTGGKLAVVMPSYYIWDLLNQN